MTETILRRIALSSAALMLFGLMGDRTTWVKLSGRGQSMTDGAIYNSVAFLSGIVALIALALALRFRPRLVVPVAGVLLAVAAFGFSLFVSGLGVWARVQGEIWAYSPGTFAEDLGPKWVVYPAVGPFVFSFLATVGALATLGLGVTWLRDARYSRLALRSSALLVARARD